MKIPRIRLNGGKMESYLGVHELLITESDIKL